MRILKAVSCLEEVRRSQVERSQDIQMYSNTVTVCFRILKGDSTFGIFCLKNQEIYAASVQVPTHMRRKHLVTLGTGGG
jgi:hypothetical protein